MKSPEPGCSLLITSAPISPSSPAQNGAAMRVPRSRTRSPSSGPPLMAFPSTWHTELCASYSENGDGTSSRQSEHSFADDVALDLVGAGEDRRRLVVEPTALPAAVARVAVGVAPQRRGGAEHGHGGVVQTLA